MPTSIPFPQPMASSDIVAFPPPGLGQPLTEFDLSDSGLTDCSTLNDAAETDSFDSSDVDGDTAILTKLRTAFDERWRTPGGNQPRLAGPPSLTSESGTQDLTTDDQVELATDYANGGQGGRVYKFLAADQEDVDLAAENYASTSRWELVIAEPKFATVTDDQKWKPGGTRRRSLHAHKN